MAQHESSQQHHPTVTVVSSMPSTMAAQQVQQQQQTGGVQQQAGSITTIPPLQSLPPNTQHPQQISAEWGHSRVQVIQQPLQNSTFLHQLYSPQAGPLLMPGNIALHPGINSQQIQVIAAGKPFQGNQLAPHMLNSQGKQVLQGQAAPFPGYTTIPAIPTTQNQTFVFSPLGVINSQPSILSAHSQPIVSGISQQQKPNEMNKTSGQTMQFAPWQISGALPQVWASGLQAGALPAGGLLAPNSIFIRGSQSDAPSSMFIHSPQNNVQHANTSVASATVTAAKPRASIDAMAKTPRPLSNIQPSTAIRPATSVSTQTASHAQNQVKHRGKPGMRSPAPTNKQDAANQTNKMQHQIQPPKQQQLLINSAGQTTQMTNMQDKNQLNNTMQQQQTILQQQQAIQQQQHQQQQQQQQQHLQHQHQQQFFHQHQTQQMVQHYHQQGMSLGMQQGALPMARMPQTVSMVQQIHPPPLQQITSQPVVVSIEAPVVPALPEPVSPAATFVAPVQPPAVVSTATNFAVAVTASSSKMVVAIDTSDTVADSSKSTPAKVKLPAPAPVISEPVSPTVVSSSAQTTPVTPQMVTTVASSTSLSVTTPAITAPVSASGTAPPLFKSLQIPSRNMSQTTAHDKCLPKAMVKPNILTHVIEGYVIQEAGEPFAVNRPLRDWSADKEQDKENKLPLPDEPPRKKQVLESSANHTRITSSVDMESNHESSAGGSEGACAGVGRLTTEATPPLGDSDQDTKIRNANKWTVEEVCDFIRNIPGCANYADDFLMQEVDGAAMLLIRPEHLVMALSMKLGPALKIVACIDSLRPDSDNTTHEHD